MSLTCSDGIVDLRKVITNLESGAFVEFEVLLGLIPKPDLGDPCGDDDLFAITNHSGHGAISELTFR